jgi:hypothetical protein
MAEEAPSTAFQAVKRRPPRPRPRNRGEESEAVPLSGKKMPSAEHRAEDGQ